MCVEGVPVERPPQDLIRRQWEGGKPDPVYTNKTDKHFIGEEEVRNGRGTKHPVVHEVSVQLVQAGSPGLEAACYFI